MCDFRSPEEVARQYNIEFQGCVEVGVDGSVLDKNKHEPGLYGVHATGGYYVIWDGNEYVRCD